MEIKVVDIDRTPVPAAGSRTRGYPARFTAGTLIGSAVLVPQEDDLSRLAPGSVLSVTPMYESVEGWGPGAEAEALSLLPLATPGDYLVNGKLLLMGSNTAAIVDAGIVALDITTRELPKPTPADGAYVTFTLRGLSLWEEPAETE